MSADETTVRAGGEADFARLEPLWRGLYQHQQEHGLTTALPADAYQKWVGWIKPVLGRFGCLFVAERDGEIVGFLAGRTRTLAPQFGGLPVGYVSDVYVTDAVRGGGVGKRLVDAALDWFGAQGIMRAELNVVAGNAAGQRFYERHGWREDLRQLYVEIPARGA
jgi:GNAT superfamily N-acetyltransferase